MFANLTFKVAGVSFNGRQEYLSQIMGNEPCRIVPEPDNKYDPNALAIHVAMRNGYVAHVGYVPRDLASQIAPLLDGEELMVEIVDVTGGFEIADGYNANLGLLLHVYIEGDDDMDYGPYPMDGEDARNTFWG